MCPGSCHTQHPHPEVNAAVVIFVKNPEDLVDEHLRPLTMIHHCHQDYDHYHHHDYDHRPNIIIIGQLSEALPAGKISE